MPERVETLPDLDVGEVLGNKKGGRISPVGPKIKPKVSNLAVRLASPGKAVPVKTAKPSKKDTSFDVVGTPKEICSPPISTPQSPDKQII